jgi:hypothetical protein
MPDIRKQAEQHLQDAVASASAAFNLANCRAWTFAPDVAARAEGMLRELYELFHGNTVHGKPTAETPPSKRLRLDLNNPDDRAFVDFAYRLTVQADDGSFVGRRARGNRSVKRGTA